MSDLEGVYCGWVPCNAQATFDFDRQFASVVFAWMDLKGVGPPEQCGPGIVFFFAGFVGETAAAEVAGPFEPTEFENQIPLIVAQAVLDGEGTVGLVANLLGFTCFDLGVMVLEATLSFNAVPIPSIRSMADLADFQRCFSGNGGGIGPDCEAFDVNADQDVDSEDYRAFHFAFQGP